MASDRSLISDRLDAADAVARLMAHVDRRRWDELGTLLADHVRLDYSSLRPTEPPEVLPREAVLARWRARHGHLRAYQHHLGPVIADLDGDVARCWATAMATHVRDGANSLWQIGLTYDWALVRSASAWRVSTMTATKLWEVER